MEDHTMNTSESLVSKSSKKRRRKRVKKIILWFLCLLLLAGAGTVTYRRLKAEHTTTYQEYTATIGSISNSLAFSGSLQLVNNQQETAPGSVSIRSIYVSDGDSVHVGDAIMRLSNGQTLEAEFDGQVNQLTLKEGDKVKSGDLLFQIADFGHMQVSIRIDEYDILDVHVGDACRVTTTATEAVFDSEISTINYVSSSTGSVAYYTATAYVDCTDVYPGMQVTVSIPRNEASDVVILKEEALSFDERNQAFVYMLAGDGTEEMVRVRVTTGVSNGNYVEIRDGLSEGDSVFVEVKANTDAVSLFSGMFNTQRINRQTRTPSGRNSNGTTNRQTPGGGQ